MQMSYAKIKVIMQQKIYPIGIQNLEKIRKEGYFYIDKTALVYRMVKTGSYYFLSRRAVLGKACWSLPSKQMDVS